MIFNWIIDILNWIISWIASKMEVASFPDEIYIFFDAVTTGINMLWLLIPMETILIIVVSVVSIETSIMAYRLANWVGNKLRGSG
jgi:hypothetical protein